MTAYENQLRNWLLILESRDRSNADAAQAMLDQLARWLKEQSN